MQSKSSTSESDCKGYLNSLSAQLALSQSQLDKLELLIDLGNQLALEAPEPDNQYLIPGCASHSHLQVAIIRGSLSLKASSQSQLTKGFLSIVSHCANNCPADKWPAVKSLLHKWFNAEGLNNSELSSRDRIAGRILDFIDLQMDQNKVSQ